MMPNGMSTKGVGALNGLGLKGGLLSPEQPTAVPEKDITPQQATTQGAALAAPQPTTGTIVMVTQERHHKLSPPVPQGKTTPQATLEPVPVVFQHPEPAHAGPKAATSGPASVVPQANPEPERAEDLHPGK